MKETLESLEAAATNCRCLSCEEYARTKRPQCQVLRLVGRLSTLLDGVRRGSRTMEEVYACQAAYDRAMQEAYDRAMQEACDR